MGQEACRWGSQWLCSRKNFLGPQAMAHTLMLKARPQEAPFRGGASRPGRCSGLTYALAHFRHCCALQGHQYLPAPPAPSDPQLRGPCSWTRAAGPQSRLIVGLRSTRAGPSAWQPLQTSISRPGLLHRSWSEGQGTSWQQRPSHVRLFTHETLDGTTSPADGSSGHPCPSRACLRRVHTCDRLGVWINEWAEGERKVASMLLASRHLALGGPVLLMREALGSQEEALGFEGG